MKKEDAYEIGRVVKTHGLKGEVGVTFNMEYPEEFINDDTVFLELKHGFVPYVIEGLQELHTKGIVKFEGIDSIAQAQALLGARVCVPLEGLPELEGDNFYLHEIIGYQVKDVALGMLGIVDNVFDMRNNIVIAMLYKSKEVLIPMNEEVVVRADKDAKILEVSLPEGLLEIYM